MTQRAKIELSPEQQTLLITLYAKAQPDNPILYDPMAREILDRVAYDVDRLRVPYKTVIMVCQRARKLDAVTRLFLEAHPDGVVVHLGCGLDSRFWRVDNGRVSWYDLDMPPVIELRAQFYKGNERYHTIASSVTAPAWIDAVQAGARSVLLVAEGLLMYLSEDEVRRLVVRLQAAFPGCRLAADVFSRLAARSAGRHRSLRSMKAQTTWGIDDPHEMETWSPGIRLLEEWFFSEDPDLAELSPAFRLAYNVAGAFNVARRAHRIAVYQL